MKWNKIKLVNISFWLVSGCIIFLYHTSCAYEHLVTNNLISTFIDISCLACCRFIIRQFLIPDFLYKNKVIPFLGLLVLLIGLFANIILAMQWGWSQLSGTASPHSAELFHDFYYQLFTIYLVVIFGCVCIVAFKLVMDQLVSQTRYNELQKEKAQTELSFLKAQINPHFLFNSINSIFAQIDKNNSRAREIVLKFSDMLRYQLYECNSDLIDFEKEFYYLNNYIELQKLRMNDDFNIAIETVGQMHGFRIAPLLLSPFIENAFKYAGPGSDGSCYAKIILTRESTHFNFYCMNTKEHVSRGILLEESGIGIHNVKRRLELLYPGKQALNIQNGESIFEVNLKIETT